MKQKLLHILIISHIIVFSFITSACSTVARQEKNVNNNSGSKKFDAEYTFVGGEGVEISDTVWYSDSMFQISSEKFSQDIAKLSFALSVSGFSSGDTVANWGVEGNVGREKNISTLLNKLNFKNAEFYGYNASLNNTSSKAAFAIASKKLHNTNSSLIAVIIRGGGYGAEWSDNFFVGSDDMVNHNGFANTAAYVEKYVDQYLNKHFSGKSLKLLICGYSRGAAVANLLAEKYCSKKIGDIFAYTFATPNTTTAKTSDLYGNGIFNIINPYDTVTSIPPVEWGFGKFGTNIVFPLHDNSEDVKILYENVGSYYESLTGKTISYTDGDVIKSLTDAILSLTNGRGEFNRIYEPVFRDMAEYSNHKELKNNKWVKPKFSDYVIEKYGDRARKALKALSDNSMIISIDEIGIELPRHLNNFMVLANIHSVPQPDESQISQMPVRVLSDLLLAFKEETITAVSAPHYPEVYLSWLKSCDISQFIS
ncbi:MAG: hypothetical protein E7395_04505 [Ruminococcaceae bacterium]|nr:hypothetical protein [Oscillospiraceae bacterium]